MSITVDATKGWALPASAAEWTSLLSGTGIANPDSAWPGQVASGNLSDVIGSLVLTANGTPNYSVAATGWSSLGVSVPDNGTHGFNAILGAGPDPATTSQVWVFVVSIEVEPTLARNFVGVNSGAAGIATTFQPAAGTNKLRITCVGVSTTGTADHSTGSYVFTLRYDRAASAAKAYSDLETVTGTYASGTTDGKKGFSFGGASPGSIVLLYAAMWSGANAETLDDTKIGTIRSKIEAPPASLAVEDEPRQVRGAVPAISPPNPRFYVPAVDEFPSANFALEEDWQPAQKERGHAEPLFLPPRYPAGFASEEWPTPVAAFGLDEQPWYSPFTRPTQRITPRPPLFWGDETIALAAGGTTVQPLGTTLAAWQAGSFTGKWVAAIEGYGNLLTDAAPALVTAAWSGSGFTAALDGLYPSLSMSQRLDPWNAFANTGGRLTLSIAPDAAGTFRRDTHLSTPAISTFLLRDVDCDDASYSVSSTTLFPSSGTVYIGSEAAAYPSKTTNFFINLRRGIYAPFRTGQSGTEGFSHPHTLSTDPNNISLPPVVSSAPRQWLGKWVGLWRHLYKGGRLNTRDEAQNCFAGRIVGVRQNPETLCTEIEVEHVLQTLQRAVIGKDLWTATFADGVWLEPGASIFGLSESDGVTDRLATPLAVVSGTPSSVYEIKEGRWDILKLISALNAWLAQAKVDADIVGAYALNLTLQDATIGHQVKIRYNIPGASTSANFTLRMPEAVWKLFGKPPASSSGLGGVEIFTSFITTGVTGNVWSAEGALRFIANGTSGAGGGVRVQLSNERGTWIDQSEDQLPSPITHLINGLTISGSFVAHPYEQCGILMVNGTDTAIVYRTAVTGDPIVTSQFERCVFWTPAGNTVTSNSLTSDFVVKFGDPPATVQQVLMYVDTYGGLLKRIFYSSGTAGYNSPDYDNLPATVGLGIPGELLGGPFESSVDNLPGASLPFTLIISKPVKLIDLLFGDLSLRWAFLRWRDEHLEFWSWMTPVDSSTFLTDANKASAVGVEDEQRSATTLDDMWQRNVVKIEYDRDFTTSEGQSQGQGYHGHVQVIDRVAIDDGGGEAKIVTINAQNTYSDHVLGGTISALLPQFRAIAPFFTRPVRRITRTIDPTFFEGYSVGDVVLVTDTYACDPDTGALGVALRPGIIVAHSYVPGGFTPQGSVADMHGEIDIMFLDNLKVGEYVPTAEVDETYSSGGYDGGNLMVYAHKHSAPTEGLDASQFPENCFVRIVEVDPADPAAPLTWDRQIGVVVDNLIEITGLSLAGYDSSKRYRIIFDDYADDTAAQQAHSFQADDADGMVSDTRAPFQYTVNTSGLTFPTPQWLKNSAADDVELPPSNSYGDGKGLDVGTDAAINRLINNLYDYKTAHNSPMLSSETIVLGDVTHSYQLYAAIPINLSPDGLSTNVRRYLYVAPHAKSSDGAGICRITLARNMPTGATLIDVDRGTIYGETSFTLGTTYSTPTEQAISIGHIKDGTGTAFLLIEVKVPLASGSATASIRGLGTCYEGPRFLWSI